MQSGSPRSLVRLGSYELVRRISSGRTAEVYEARHAGPRGFAKRVALKRVLPQLAQDAKLARAFCASARVQAALTHPNLVSVLDFGEAEGELYLVMEYVDGVSLSDVLSALMARKRRMELAPALYLAREVAAGLQHAHEHQGEADAPRGVVHRDVSPSHVLLGRAGVVKLTDFGMRRALVSELRAVEELREKLGYVSPEQAQGREAEPRSDLFSLGVVLAEMLLGAPLVVGTSAAQILENLQARPWEGLAGLVGHAPPPVIALVQKLLARSPRNRPVSAAHVVAELDRLASAHTARASAHDFSLWLADLGVVRLESNVRLTPSHGDAAELLAAESTAREEQATLVDDDALKPVAVALPAVHLEVAPLAPTRTAPTSPPGLRYRLRRPGGEIVGPVSLATVLAMLATARAGLDSELARDDGPFLRLSRAFELTRLASRPLYRFFEPIALLATERQPVERASFPAHLLRIARERRTGLLVQRSGAEQRRIYFEQGTPLASASTDGSELLGAQLLRRRLVGAADLERVLESGYRSGCQLGESLVRAGLLTEQALATCLSEQRVERLAALCHVPSGELFFVEGAVSGETCVGTEPAIATLLEALRRAYAAPELLALLGGLERTALRPSASCAELRRTLSFSADEAYAFDLCLRGVKLGLVLREAQVRGESSLRAAGFAIFIGLSAGAFVARPD
ncbi:MAG: serine/threonine protein kinase [Polyangiaceae bacterium]|nr:serine/threonine protein kinase [Polyangiaceae bacterium]